MTEQPHERHAVHARERIPQGHVDSRERHANQALRPEQPESPGERLVDLGRGQCFALHQGLEIPD